MKKRRSGKTTYYYCDDDHDFQKQNFDTYVRWLTYDFTKRKTFKRLLDAYGRLTGIDGYALIEAHGSSHNGIWTFDDGSRIQELLDEVDGKYMGVFLCVCNPDNSCIETEKSAVIHPAGNINRLGLMRWAPLRFYLPGEGYIEKRYERIRKALERMNSVEYHEQ